jgi:hypothetical protein
MRRRRGETLVGFLCALALAVAPSPAQADSAPEDGSDGARSRLQVSLRVGYSIPLGAFRGAGAYAISDAIGAQVPFTLDVGYRFRSPWYVGVFGSVAPGSAGDELRETCAAMGCTVIGYRFGGLAIAYLNREGKASPWVGVGAGGEVSTIDVSDPRGNVASTVRGVDFIHALFGFDIKPHRAFGFGPFLQLASGIYTDRRVSTPRYTADEGMEEWAVHAWFTAGMRAVLWP